MKNLLKLLMAGVLLTSVSCVQDITDDLTVGAPGTATEFTVGIEAPRVVLGDKDAMGKYPLYWSNGDKISINGIASTGAVIEEGVKTSQANFVVTPGEDQVLVAPFNVLYPSNTAGQVVFKTSQTFTEGTFANGTTPMYGYSDESATLTLKNLAGALKIGVKGEEGLLVKRVTVESPDGAPLSGTFDIDCTTGVLTATENVYNLAAVTSSAGVALSPEEATYFYIAIPAGEYSPVNVVISTADGQSMRVSAKDAAGADKFTLEAGQIKTFNELTFADNAVAFEIFDIDGFFEFADMVKAGTFSKNYDKVVLVSDVYMASGSKPWETLEGFNGVFDGQGFGIYDLSVPLFGESAATISNVKLVAPRITVSGRMDAGALVCTLVNYGIYTGSLKNCHTVLEEGVGELTYTGVVVENEEVTGKHHIGGLVGYASNSNVVIENCSNSLNVTVNGTLVSAVDLGGIVGQTAGSLKNLTNTGTIKYSGEKATGLRIGGIAGIASKGTSGSVNGEAATVEGATATGAVVVDGSFVFPTDGKYEFNVGGLIGRTGGAISSSVNNGPVTVSSDLVAPTTNGNDWGSFGIGGCIGRGATTYTNVENTGAITVSSNIAATAYTASKMHPILIGGVFAYGGSANNTNLKNSGNITVSGTHAYTAMGVYVGGIYCRGTNGKNYTFTGFENSGAITASVEMTNTGTSVKLAGIVSYQMQARLEKSYNKGAITFNGTVYSSQLYVGGVSTVDHNDAVYDECGNEGAITINGNIGNGYAYIGGLFDSIDTKVSVTNCYNSGAITLDATSNNATGSAGANFAKMGGLVGGVSGLPTVFSNCYNSGNITSAKTLKYYGGCFGHISSAINLDVWTNIRNSGDVTYPKGTPGGVMYIGGVAGCVDGSHTGTVKQWHNSGNIYAGADDTTVRAKRMFIGGIVGIINATTFSYCSNTGNVIAPWYRYASDVNSWVGLIAGTRYYHTGSAGTGSPTFRYTDHCLVKGTIKRRKMDKSGAEECTIASLEDVYKFAFAEPDSMEGDQDPTLYFTNISITEMPVEPAQ